MFNYMLKYNLHELLKVISDFNVWESKWLILIS
jgi:hypothetical protein